VHVDTGGRRATGAHLVYRAADERYELTGRRGAPVRVVDPCGETEGATLIFFTSTDRMVVDGHEQVRTRTTGRRTCEEAPAP
jgi:lipopolysaccharide export system protein LptA